jgi:predicted AAA+ superfamily ATPase
VDVGAVEAAATLFANAMRHAFELEMPLKAGVEAGKTWADLETVKLMELANPPATVWQTRHERAGKSTTKLLANPPRLEDTADVLQYVPRHLLPLIEAALEDTRVVTISGARQAGKSTLVHRLLRARKGSLERRLDRPAELAAAKADPARFVRHDGLLAIDEVQRAPELALSIKAEVDEDPRPGRYLLTGSARLVGRRALADSLVWRMETLELWPFSQGELARSRDDFVDRVFEDEPDLRVETGESRDGYVDRLTRGGLPEAVRRDDGRRSRFFASYIDDLIDRDVMQLAEIHRRDALRRLLSEVAGRAAQLVKVEALASDIAAPASTVERYLALLEEVFLIKRVPAWSAATTGRAVHMSKVLFVDTGLCAHLQGRTQRRLLRDDAALGALLENFVIGELARQLGWSKTRATLHHFRTRDGVEVDAVLEAADGRLAGFEVKAAETVRAEDFGSLRYLQARAPKHFHLGVVFFTGRSVLPFGKDLLAVPIESLWR